MLSMAWCDHSSIMFPTDDGRVFLLPCTFHYVQLFILRVINIKVLTTSFGKSARSTVVVLTWKQKIKVQCCARTPKWLVGLLSDSTLRWEIATSKLVVLVKESQIFCGVYKNIISASGHGLVDSAQLLF